MNRMNNEEFSAQILDKFKSMRHSEWEVLINKKKACSDTLCYTSSHWWGPLWGKSCLLFVELLTVPMISAETSSFFIDKIYPLLVIMLVIHILLYFIFPCGTNQFTINLLCLLKLRIFTIKVMGLICILYKKGDAMHCKNYKPLYWQYL